ncbi:MAG: carboxylesterase family protein [Patulibacter minatonensis]
MDAAPVVELASGSVRGSRVDATGTLRFVGIPYAAPPVGARRFAAPQPAEPWVGVRDASVMGRAAPQVPALRPLVGPALAARRSRGENCLVVNVDTPRLDGPPRPVVVWIHGGGFATGTANQHDGSVLAARGDVVVIAVNYRLGALGFVDLAAALGADRRIASNLGLRDQIAALAWVREHVAAFGGDPERVTIAGESAGAGCIAGLLVSPAARGLFHGAIVQSGALTLTTEPEDAEAAAREVLEQLDVSRERADELWRRPAGALVRAAHRAQRRRTGSLVTRPWWDGDVLPASLAEAYGATAPVPLMIGWNADEHRTFTKVRRPIMPMTRAALATAITEAWGWEETAPLLAEYPADADGLNDLGTDLVFAMPSVHLAERHAERAPVWTYRLDLRAGRFGMGAFHGLDLMLLFPQGPRAEWLALGRPDQERAALAERFKDAWLGFVREGRPGGTSVGRGGAPAAASDGGSWAAYDPAGARTTRIFDRTDRLLDDPQGARRRAWAGRDVRIR